MFNPLEIRSLWEKMEKEGVPNSRFVITFLFTEWVVNKFPNGISLSDLYLVMPKLFQSLRDVTTTNGSVREVHAAASALVKAKRVSAVNDFLYPA